MMIIMKKRKNKTSWKSGIVIVIVNDMVVKWSREVKYWELNYVFTFTLSNSFTKYYYTEWNGTTTKQQKKENFVLTTTKKLCLWINPLNELNL